MEQQLNDLLNELAQEVAKGVLLSTIEARLGNTDLGQAKPEMVKKLTRIIGLRSMGAGK